MLEGLLRMEGGDQILPFVCVFHNNPSTCLWEDELGVTQHVAQGEGGEQGDPLMPLLFALGQHKSLVEAQARLSGNERSLAFFDDIHIASMPGGFGSTHHCGRRAFDPTHTSTSTTAKPKCGIVVVWSLRASLNCPEGQDR